MNSQTLACPKRSRFLSILLAAFMTVSFVANEAMYPKRAEANQVVAGVVIIVVGAWAISKGIEKAKDWIFGDDKNIQYNCTALSMGQISNPSPEMKKACSKQRSANSGPWQRSANEVDTSSRSDLTLFTELVEIKKDLENLNSRLRPYQSPKLVKKLPPLSVELGKVDIEFLKLEIAAQEDNLKDYATVLSQYVASDGKSHGEIVVLAYKEQVLASYERINNLVNDLYKRFKFTPRRAGGEVGTGITSIVVDPEKVSKAGKSVDIRVTIGQPSSAITQGSVVAMVKKGNKVIKEIVLEEDLSDQTIGSSESSYKGSYKISPNRGKQTIFYTFSAKAESEGGSLISDKEIIGVVEQSVKKK